MAAPNYGHREKPSPSEQRCLDTLWTQPHRHPLFPHSPPRQKDGPFSPRQPCVPVASLRKPSAIEQQVASLGWLKGSQEPIKGDNGLHVWESEVKTGSFVAPSLNTAVDLLGFVAQPCLAARLLRTRDIRSTRSNMELKFWCENRSSSSFTAVDVSRQHLFHNSRIFPQKLPTSIVET